MISFSALNRWRSRIHGSGVEREQERRHELGYEPTRTTTSEQSSATNRGSDHNWYSLGAAITAIVVFPVCWIYCVTTYGFFLGVGLGWFPSIVIAALAALLWPIIALSLIALLLFIFKI